MTNQDLINIGFTKIFKIGHALTFDIGRGRTLEAYCIGTPNEMLYICERNEQYDANDMICLHNWDYDGPLTLERVKKVICAIHPGILKDDETPTGVSAVVIERKYKVVDRNGNEVLDHIHDGNHKTYKQAKDAMDIANAHGQEYFTEGPYTMREI